jgi:hypothetical protein
MWWRRSEVPLHERVPGQIIEEGRLGADVTGVEDCAVWAFDEIPEWNELSL